MAKQKNKNKPIKKYFWIPFSLSLVILLVGIVMTITKQTDLAKFGGKHSYTNYTLTGPGVIALGITLIGLMLYSKKYLK